MCYLCGPRLPTAKQRFPRAWHNGGCEKTTSLNCRGERVGAEGEGLHHIIEGLYMDVEVH